MLATDKKTNFEQREREYREFCQLWSLPTNLLGQKVVIWPKDNSHLLSRSECRITSVDFYAEGQISFNLSRNDGISFLHSGHLSNQDKWFVSVKRSGYIDEIPVNFVMAEESLTFVY